VVAKDKSDTHMSAKQELRYCRVNGNSKDYNLVGPSGGLIAVTPYEEKARRLVACWNACEGLPTEKLEGTNAGAAAYKIIVQLERQLDEAVALLRDEVLEFVEGQADVVDGSYGVPHANRAMQIAQEICAFLDNTSSERVAKTEK
jgi:hypothetical protein